jgi:excinuclease UvrABC ATPase subunit
MRWIERENSQMRKLFSLTLAVAVVGFAALAVNAGEHEAVGTQKCAKMCHKVQLKSWEASKHATAEKPTDCEACHGNGADYGKMKIMKDREAAVAAGMVIPTKEACTATCHKGEDITDEAFANVHEHKAKK